MVNLYCSWPKCRTCIPSFDLSIFVNICFSFYMFICLWASVLHITFVTLLSSLFNVQYVSMKCMDTFRVKSSELFLVCPCVHHHPGTTTAENIFVIRCHCWSTSSDTDSRFWCTDNKCLCVATACCDWLKLNLSINDLTWTTGTSYHSIKLDPANHFKKVSEQTNILTKFLFQEDMFHNSLYILHLAFPN